MRDRAPTNEPILIRTLVLVAVLALFGCTRKPEAVPQAATTAPIVPHSPPEQIINAGPEPTVTDEEVRYFYDHNLELNFHYPERIRLGVIEVKPEPGEAEASREVAEKIYAEAQESQSDPNGFSALAKKYNDRNTYLKSRGGDLGAQTRRDLVAYGFEEELLDRAAQEKNLGQLALTRYREHGWAIVKFLGSTPEHTDSFESVREKIRNDLLQAKKHGPANWERKPGGF